MQEAARHGKDSRRASMIWALAMCHGWQKVGCSAAHSVWSASELKGRKGYPAFYIPIVYLRHTIITLFLSSTSRVRLSLGAAFGE